MEKPVEIMQKVSLIMLVLWADNGSNTVHLGAVFFFNVLIYFYKVAVDEMPLYGTVWHTVCPLKSIRL